MSSILSFIILKHGSSSRSMFSTPDWRDGQLKAQFGYLPDETSTVYSTKQLLCKSPFSARRATPSERRQVEESPEVFPAKIPRLEAGESRKATDIVPRTRNPRRLKRYHVKSRNGCRTCRPVRCGSFSVSLCFYCRRYEPLQLGKPFAPSFLVRAQIISL